MARTPRKELTMAQRKAITLLVESDITGMTYGQISDAVGVNSKTLYAWRHNQLFRDELNKQAEEIQNAFLNDAYQTLRGLVKNKEVSDGNKLKAIEMVLKNQGRLKDVQESTVTVEEKSLDDILSDIVGD